MNLDHLQNKLLAAAKASPPADRVPLAFEKRVLAHLTAKPAVDLTTLWSRALWRATVPCLALMLVLTGLALFPTETTNSSTVTTGTTTTTEDLSTVFEQTLLASSDQVTTLDFLEDN
jgi:hypothetical protein